MHNPPPFKQPRQPIKEELFLFFLSYYDKRASGVTSAINIIDKATDATRVALKEFNKL